MSVFISWSGPTSKLVAETLRVWLPKVIQATAPWISSSDIQAGSRWSPEITKKLDTSKFAIVCVTPDNITNAPWLTFEAGAVAKILENRVVPYLFRMETADIPAGHPFTQFQAVKADREGTHKLLSSLNASLTNPLEAQDLAEIFSMWWPKLDEALCSIKPQTNKPTAHRSAEEKIDDILGVVREIRNRQASERTTRTRRPIGQDLRAEIEAYLELTQAELRTEGIESGSITPMATGLRVNPTKIVIPWSLLSDHFSGKDSTEWANTIDALRAEMTSNRTRTGAGPFEGGRWAPS